MKLVFPHKEHKDFDLIGDNFTIGSSDEATITVEAIGMAKTHAILTKNNGVFSLTIDNPACMVSVNGRLIKDSEEAREVREGDLMIISQVHCKIESSKKEEQRDDNRTRIRMALPKFVIRGVSGVYFGKTFPLRGKTSLGRHSDNDIFVNVDGISRKHAVISVTTDGLEVEDLGSSNGTFVNGQQITKKLIKMGDEIKLDNIRFLIQSPGAPTASGQLNKPSNAAINKVKPIGSSTIENSSGSSGKWVAVVVVLLSVAVAGAWSIGLLDKFL